MKRTLRCKDLTHTDSTAMTMVWDVKETAVAAVAAAVAVAATTTTIATTR